MSDSLDGALARAQVAAHDLEAELEAYLNESAEHGTKPIDVVRTLLSVLDTGLAPAWAPCVLHAHVNRLPQRLPDDLREPLSHVVRQTPSSGLPNDIAVGDVLSYDESLVAEVIEVKPHAVKMSRGLNPTRPEWVARLDSGHWFLARANEPVDMPVLVAAHAVQEMRGVQVEYDGQRWSAGYHGITNSRGRSMSWAQFPDEVVHAFVHPADLDEIHQNIERVAAMYPAKISDLPDAQVLSNLVARANLDAWRFPDVRWMLIHGVRHGCSGVRDRGQPTTAPRAATGKKAAMFAMVADLAGSEMCQSCGISPAIALDHDHLTGAVRGILCPSCNADVDRCLHRNGCHHAEYLNNPPAKPLGLIYPGVGSRKRERFQRATVAMMIRSVPDLAHLAPHVEGFAPFDICDEPDDHRIGAALHRRPRYRPIRLDGTVIGPWSTPQYRPTEWWGR